MSSKLPYTEELDFHYLLGLMPPLYSTPEYAWLPELFSVIGHEKLILLAKYAGGEKIQIPTLDELLNSIDALQWFYDVNINHTKDGEGIPAHLYPLYQKICEVYHVRSSQTNFS